MKVHGLTSKVNAQHEQSNALSQKSQDQKHCVPPGFKPSPLRLRAITEPPARPYTIKLAS